MSYVRDVADNTDLGILRWDEARDCLVGMFGDTDPWGDNWKSPVVMCFDRDYRFIGIPGVVDGVQVVEQGFARQLWAYPHNNPVFSTVLPTDFIRLGGWWYVSVMVTQGLGNEVWVEFQRSRDLVTWEHTGKYISPKEHPNMVMLSYDVFGDWVYIVGTGGLKRNMAVYMWRNKIEEFPHGEWVVANVAGFDPILFEPSGELCLRNVDDAAVLSRFVNEQNNWRVEASVLDEPGKEWTSVTPVRVADHLEFPQLYGGFLSPLSKLGVQDGAKWFVSQWDTVSGDNDPYKVMLCKGTLPAIVHTST